MMEVVERFIAESALILGLNHITSRRFVVGVMIVESALIVGWLIVRRIQGKPMPFADLIEQVYEWVAARVRK